MGFFVRVCAAAEEAGPIQPRGGDQRSEDAENQCDNDHIDRKHGSTDPTYLARKIMTEHPDTFGKLKAVCAVADLVRMKNFVKILTKLSCQADTITANSPSNGVRVFIGYRVSNKPESPEYVKRGRPAKGEEKRGNTASFDDERNTNPGVRRRLAREHPDLLDRIEARQAG